MAQWKTLNIVLSGMLLLTASCRGAVSAESLAAKQTAPKIGYDLPPKNVLDVMIAPLTPRRHK